MGLLWTWPKTYCHGYLETATEEVKNRALRQAWDSIDNRFGQLVYDNLFWNKSAKDIGMVMTRSLGWNLGTVREIGGGLKDLATRKGMTG